MTPRLEWLLSVIKKRRRWLLLCVVLSAIVGAGVYFSLPRIYESTFDLQVRKIDVPVDMEMIKSLFLANKLTADTQISVISSTVVLEQSLKAAGLISESTNKNQIRALVDGLKKDVLVRLIDNATILRVTVRNPDPKTSYDLANAVMVTYTEYERESRIQSYRDVRDNLEKMLKEVRKKKETLVSSRDVFLQIQQQEAGIQKIQKELQKIIDDVEKEKSTLRAQLIRDLQVYTEDWHEMKVLRAKMEYLNGFSREAQSSIYSSHNSSSLALDAYGGSHPIANGGPDPDSAFLAMWTNRKADYKRLHDEMSALTDMFDRSLLRAWREHPEIYDLDQLDRDLTTMQKTEMEIQQHISKYDTSIQTTASNVQVLSPPIVPDTHSSPNVMTTIFTIIFLALLLSISLIYVMEYLDTALRTVEDIQFFTGRDVLAVIPHIVSAVSDQRSGHILVYNEKEKKPLPAIEPYRSLKTNLIFSIPNVPNPAILLSSSTMQEGKSTTTVNLACAFSEDRSTLLLSCNLRRPTVYQYFDLDIRGGIVDIIEGNLTFDAAVKRTFLPNLHVITAGRIAENSSILLNRPAFTRLIEEGKRRYDVVLVDSPPVLMLTDAAVIATRVDAVALVYSLADTQKRDLMRAINLLSRVNGKVAGVVANMKRDIDFARKRYYYYR